MRSMVIEAGEEYALCGQSSAKPVRRLAGLGDPALEARVAAASYALDSRALRSRRALKIRRLSACRHVQRADRSGNEDRDELPEQCRRLGARDQWHVSRLGFNESLCNSRAITRRNRRRCRSLTVAPSAAGASPRRNRRRCWSLTVAPSAAGASTAGARAL